MTITRSKYRVRTDPAGKALRTVDGILFASAKEAKRYAQLKLLERGKAILDLILQPRFDLYISDNERSVCLGEYVADFEYRTAAGERVIEDVKGVKTDLFKWKLRHFEAEYRIKVLLT